MPPLETDELDEVYALPYMKNYHPMYEKTAVFLQYRKLNFSLAANRGCFGSCNFCALAFHQGRIVTSRSDESLIKEAEEMTKCLILRAIYTMSEVRPLISEDLPVKNN